jgi:hypothetical protein
VLTGKALVTGAVVGVGTARGAEVESEQEVEVMQRGRRKKEELHGAVVLL